LGFVVIKGAFLGEGTLGIVAGVVFVVSAGGA
jgi:FAD/FMN-containing dehydrogenase